ncbi:hypothetical protein NHJ6243_008237 [Beauveria neobassiana]
MVKMFRSKLKAKIEDPEECRNNLSHLKRNIPLWRRLKKRMFRSKLKSKIAYPENRSEIGYQVKRGSPLLKLGVWMLAFFLYVMSIRIIVVRHGFDCEVKETELGRDYGFLDSLVGWTFCVVAAGATFLVGQGYFGLRATRDIMERVQHSATTLAYVLLKTSECLALLTAYPVALLHKVRGNCHEPAVTRYCQQIASNLKALRDGEIVIARPPNETSWRGGPGQPDRFEFFFELFSLHLEEEFSDYWRKSTLPSMMPEHIICQLRDHFENLIDSHRLDPSLAPHARENIDMLALSGKQCRIYAGCDVIPICTLWIIDICCRMVVLFVPVRRCSWLVKTVGLDLLVRIVLIVVASTMAMLLLAEMWSFWDPFGKGMSTFSWTLGLASELDNMLSEFWERETERRQHFMDPSSVSCSTVTMTTTTMTTTTMTRTTGSEREGSTSSSSNETNNVHG